MPVRSTMVQLNRVWMYGAIGVESRPRMVKMKMPEQECRWIGDMRIWITSGMQLYVLYCRAKVDDELPGVEFNDSITAFGSPVPRSDCIGEWRVDLTMGFKLAWVAVPTAEYG